MTGSHYKTLNDSYIIFVCLFDVIGKGRPLYTFENICLEGGTETLRYRSGKTDFAVNFSLFSVSLFNSGAYATIPVQTGLSVRWEPFENTRKNWKVMLRLRLQ